MAYLIGFAPVPFSVDRIQSLSGGQRILDVMFAYSPTEGAMALDALGDGGRRHYNYFQMADIIFPATYAVALSSTLLALFRGRRWAVGPALVPIVTALFDYVENLGVFAALRTYPDPWPAALAAASAAGALKLVCFYIAAGLVIAGAIDRWFIRRRK